METDELREFLRERGIDVDEQRIQNATQFRCPYGENFCVYDSGKLVVQGKSDTELARTVAESSSGGWRANHVRRTAGETEASDVQPIFVVYGHDDIGARDNLELL